MKKGQIYEGTVDHIDFPNKGIIKIEEENVIVKNAITGQKVRFSVNKVKNKKFEGRLLEILERSPLEVRDKMCSNFDICGGCTYQRLDYNDQLKIKEGQVKRLLKQVCDGFEFEGIIGSPVEVPYRNKMEFSFGNEVKDGPLTLGLHKIGSFHDIVKVIDCKIVDNDYNLIQECVLEYFVQTGVSFYHKLKHEGFLRHLIIRQGKKTGELLVNLVTTSKMPEQVDLMERVDLMKLVERLKTLRLKGKIVGVLHTANDSLADVVKCDEMEVLYGQNYFFEELLGLKFKISPFSFFQTNSLGAEVLYGKVREYVGDTKDKVIFDLYSGTGTIAQILAPVAKKVVGVEIVEEAVRMARVNAGLNGLENCEFIAGDVLKVIDGIEEKPDLVVLDPPRDGIHPKALLKICENVKADRMVYISCKPTSLVRDIEVMKEKGYEVEKACCVDLFPETHHVECVVLLSKVQK